MARKRVRKHTKDVTVHDYVHDVKNFCTKSIGAFVQDIARHTDKPLTEKQCNHNKEMLRDLSAAAAAIGDNFAGKSIYQRIDEFLTVYEVWNEKDKPREHRDKHLKKLKKKTQKLVSAWAKRIYRIEKGLDIQRAEAIHNSFTNAITTVIRNPASILYTLANVVRRLWRND